MHPSKARWEGQDHFGCHAPALNLKPHLHLTRGLFTEHTFSLESTSSSCRIGHVIGAPDLADRPSVIELTADPAASWTDPSASDAPLRALLTPALASSMEGRAPAPPPEERFVIDRYDSRLDPWTPPAAHMISWALVLFPPADSCPGLHRLLLSCKIVLQCLHVLFLRF